MLTRALIVLLLVLNLGVALWWSLREAPSAPSPAPLPAGVERLQLVGESESGGAGSVPPPPQPVAVTQCWRLGPFADAAAATSAGEALEPVAVMVRPYRDYAGTANNWKVLMAPAATMADAEATAARIGAAGFSDRFVIRAGEDARAVALGLYGSQSRAQERADTLRAAGFAVDVLPVGAGPARHWIDIAAGEAFTPDAIALAPGAPDMEPLDCTASGLAVAAGGQAEPGAAR